MNGNESCLWNGAAHDTHPIRQLRQAIETRTNENAKVISAILIMTNATKSDGLERARAELEDESRIPVTIMEKKAFLDLMVDSMLDQYLELRT